MRALFFLLLFSLASAGPVGRYLGYEVGSTHTSSHQGRDSLHVFFPVQFDTVIFHSWNDTISVIAETLRQGQPAYVTRNVVVTSIGPPTTSFDTVYESGDSLLCGRYRVGDSTVWADNYFVPFDSGDWWRPGIEGTYLVNLNNDTIIDTVSFWGDTTFVLGIEDVELPGRTVPGCYKLLTKTWQSLATQESIFPIRETSYIQTFEWYKDSVWVIKDSVDIKARAYVWFIVWIRAADIFASDVGIITSLPVRIREPDAEQAWPALAVSPTHFIRNVRISLLDGDLRHVRIYGADGRTVRTLAAPRAVYWDGYDEDGRAVPPGAYVVQGPVGCWPALAIKLR